jgi:hypothetical protein
VPVLNVKTLSLIQNGNAKARVLCIPGTWSERAALGVAVKLDCIRGCKILVFDILALIAIVTAASSLAAPTQIGTKTVLFISSERSDMPAMRELEETVRNVFHDSADPEIELFPEYLDFARFPIEQYAAADIRYLRERYADQRIDLILVATGFSLEFVLSHRDELFPKAPIVFCAAPDREIVRPQLPPDVTGVIGHFDIERTIKLIFTLQPNVTEIVCVGGTSGFDRFWQEETRKVLERFVDRTRFRWITDESLKQTTNELSKLPPSSAVFYVTMLRDGGGTHDDGNGRGAGSMPRVQSAGLRINCTLFGCRNSWRRCFRFRSEWTKGGRAGLEGAAWRMGTGWIARIGDTQSAGSELGCTQEVATERIASAEGG